MRRCVRSQLPPTAHLVGSRAHWASGAASQDAAKPTAPLLGATYRLTTHAAPPVTLGLTREDGPPCVGNNPAVDVHMARRE
jgi:hypothetical protein